MILLNSAVYMKRIFEDYNLNTYLSFIKMRILACSDFYIYIDFNFIISKTFAILHYEPFNRIY